MVYSLSDIAKMYNIPVSTLRYYEKEGILPFMRRDANGYFLIDKADESSFQLLRLLREAGCPVKTIAEVIRLSEEAKHAEQNRSASDQFVEIADILSRHSDELLRRQQALLWQTEVTNYLRWEFARYIRAGTSLLDDEPYPGAMPPDFSSAVPDLSFEELAAEFSEKYLNTPLSEAAAEDDAPEKPEF